MITVEEAKNIIFNHCKITPVIELDLKSAGGAVLAEDIKAPFPMPRFNNSAMDGFCVKSDDILKASEKNPIVLTLIGEIVAGDSKIYELNHGECYRIMTGARIPAGSDCVVMKEVVKENEIQISFFNVFKKFTNIRFVGEDIQQGQVVLKKGHLIKAAQIALLAALGKDRVRTFQPLSVSILSTGSELVSVTESKYLENAHIYDSNSYMLEHLLHEEKCRVNRLGIAKDDKNSLINKIEEGLQSDILIISGGVSVGEHDLVKEVLSSLGVEELFWKIKIKPGKPVFFGKSTHCLVFGLPGNPASSYVAYHEFVKPMIRKCLGMKQWEVPKLNAILTHPLKRGMSRKQYLRSKAWVFNGQIHVEALNFQGSHSLSSLADSNSFIVIDEMADSKKEGEIVQIQLLENLS